MLLHEMAHMWFGNLVTLAWWNDVWLNESFADYFSYLAAESLYSVQFPETQIYLSKRKMWGMKTDSISEKTHELRSSVQNTTDADGIFDGISYGKG